MKGTEYVGKVFKSNKCGDVVVLEYENCDNVTVKFLDTGVVMKTQSHHLKDGAIKDRMSPSVHGVGVLGDQPSTINGVKTKEYHLWRGMITRCYSPKTYIRYPTYTHCEVSEYFKNYSNFKVWCGTQIGFGKEGWELDKDILLKGNKVYSEDTCCFVPKAINLLLCKSDSIRGKYPLGVKYCQRSKGFIATVTKENVTHTIGKYNTSTEAFNAYKVAKEAHIKLVISKWKDELDPRVYDALYNWEVKITD